jgi:hypothetical protein
MKIRGMWSVNDLYAITFSSRNWRQGIWFAVWVIAPEAFCSVGLICLVGGLSKKDWWRRNVHVHVPCESRESSAPHGAETTKPYIRLLKRLRAILLLHWHSGMMSGCVVFKAAYTVVAKCSRRINRASLNCKSLLYCFNYIMPQEFNVVASGECYEVT